MGNEQNNIDISLEKHCSICREKVLETGDDILSEKVVKKFDTYGQSALICNECLDLPIRCLKGSITLGEVIHRVRALRGLS